MGRQGFSKLSAYKAYSKMDKSCAASCVCSALCQLFMAKEIIGASVTTGAKFSDKIPEDIMDLFRSMPCIPERYSPMELHDAFEEVQSICDDCSLELHDKYCSVNVVLTALGILVYGREFESEKDKEVHQKLNNENEA